MDSSSSTVSEERLSYKMKNTELVKKILVQRNGVDVVDSELKKTRSLTWVERPSPPRPRFLRYNPHRSKEILTRIQKAIEVRTTVISAMEQENQSVAKIIEKEEEDDIEEEEEEQKSVCSFKGLFKLLSLMYVLMQWSSYMSNTNSFSPVLTTGPEGEGYYWRNQSQFEGKEWRPPFSETSDEALLLQLMMADESNLDEEKTMLMPKEEIPVHDVDVFLNYYSEVEDLVKEEISDSVLESLETVDSWEEEIVDQTQRSSGNSMSDPPPLAESVLIPSDLQMDDDEEPKDAVEEFSSTTLGQLLLITGSLKEEEEEELAEKPVVGVAVWSIHSIHMMLKVVVGFAALSFVSAATAVWYLRRNFRKKKKPTTAVRSRGNRPDATTTTVTCVKEDKMSAASDDDGSFPPPKLNHVVTEEHPPPHIIRAATVELLSELEFQPQKKKGVVVNSKENVRPLLHPQTASFEFSIRDSRNFSITNFEDAGVTTTKALATPIRRSTRLQNRGWTTIQSPYAAAAAATPGGAANSLR